MIPELDPETRGVLIVFFVLAGLVAFAKLIPEEKEVDPNIRQIEIDNQFVLDKQPGGLLNPR